MRHLGRHCISNQSSGLRTDARTGQSMPHRRSSDVANAVWLIFEEAIYPGNHLAINNGFYQNPPRCLVCLWLRTELGMPAHNTQKGRHKMARSDVRQSVLTGYPTVDGFAYGTSCLRSPNSNPCGGEMLQHASVSRPPSLPHSRRGQSRLCRTNVPSSIDYVSPLVASRLTLGINCRESSEGGIAVSR